MNQPGEAPRCDRTAAWVALQGHFEAHGRHLDLRERFASDPDRFKRFWMTAPQLHADLSKNLWDLATQRLLVELAAECHLEARRDAMLRGEAVNVTEGRAVLHTALRAPRGVGPFSDTVHEVLEAMLTFAEAVRAQAGQPYTDVVNIGIGGSDLGPAMAVAALAPHGHPALRLHFVSNVDGHDIDGVLRGLRPERTLFIIASKTFTTHETMANARAARSWFDAGMPPGADPSRHFVGVTTNLRAAAEFGIRTTFGFWDWVGGRFSLWSAIGLPIAVAVGAQGFRDLLAGAHEMDCHFAQSPLAQNLPVQLGLLDVWYRNFHGFASRSVAPYHQGLRRFPAYLQQLEMESNGKSVDSAGQPLPFATSPVVWGEPGTNGQHAYFQMLHQGTDVIPVEFIAVRQPAHGLVMQHRQLLANCLAQSQALMLGQTPEQAASQQAPTADPSFDRAALSRHRSFPGNRPSTTLVLETLSPRALGALVALYEHRVWTSGALWGINSFDQWGVELGKALCSALLPRWPQPGQAADVQGLDASTAGLLQHLSAVNRA